MNREIGELSDVLEKRFVIPSLGGVGVGKGLINKVIPQSRKLGTYIKLMK